MKLTFLIALSIFFLAGNIFAQELKSQEGIYRASYGIFADFSFNQHSANFQGLPGVPSCCPRYERGTGTGPAVGGIFQLPLTNLFDLQLRAAYRSLSGTLSATETTTVLQNGQPVQGAFKHTLSTGLSTVGIEPLLGITVIGGLKLHLGLSGGLLVSKQYSQQEEIVQPDGGGTFADSFGTDTHSRIRNNLSGTIPNTTNIQLAALGGVSYTLPLNKTGTVFLAPEIFYSFGITKIASDLQWKVNSLRAGIALMFSPEKVPEIPVIEKPPIVRIDTPKATKMYALETSLSAQGVYGEGKEIPIVRMTVEEYYSTNMTPLLNYIFFAENSSDIAERYNRLTENATDTFATRHIHSPDKLSTYYHILNIIGERLFENPGAMLTLTGCNQDIRDEKNNMKLSRGRAEAVRKYFIDVWKVSQGRIVVQTRNLSAKAAITGTPDADEENRRVEITSSDPKILFPVITDDTLRTSNPPLVRFKPVVHAEAGAASWRLSAFQAKKLLKQFDGIGEPPNVIDWKLDQSSMPRFSGDIQYSFSVRDSKGTLSEANNAIPTEQITIRKKREERRGDTVINRFSLILFDVGSSEITSAQAPIAKLIDEYIKPNSQVAITGYTDRLGDVAFNKKLSEQRAAALAKALKGENISAHGTGQADLYDPSLPEGRLYSRTVDVVVETPVAPN